ncbi:hypothetical protein BE221DRAFT_68027, partial [Ostreococcus tauri]
SFRTSGGKSSRESVTRALTTPPKLTHLRPRNLVKRVPLAVAHTSPSAQRTNASLVSSSLTTARGPKSSRASSRASSRVTYAVAIHASGRMRANDPSRASMCGRERICRRCVKKKSYRLLSP